MAGSFARVHIHFHNHILRNCQDTIFFVFLMLHPPAPQGFSGHLSYSSHRIARVAEASQCDKSESSGVGLSLKWKSSGLCLSRVKLKDQILAIFIETSSAVVRVHIKHNMSSFYFSSSLCYTATASADCVWQTVNSCQ